MADNVKVKDPGATLQYGFNWADWLPTGDTIDIASITISPSSVTGSLVNTGSMVTTSGCVLMTLSGGTAGTRYNIVCTIKTATGSYIDERTMKMDVKNR